jgi:hypothetical protein
MYQKFVFQLSIVASHSCTATILLNFFLNYGNTVAQRFTEILRVTPRLRVSVVQLLNKEQNAQVCDATMLNSSNVVWYKK